MNRQEHKNQSQARLIQSVFTYIATCLKDRDHRSMRRFRLRADQTERISRMTATDFLRLGEFGSECVTLDVDPEALDEVFRAIDEQRRHEELAERCIRRDAPRAMMQTFFGVSRHRYSKLRTAFGMPPRAGRLARAPEPLEQQIYALWTACGERWTARSLLDIANTLDVSLRIVWRHLSHDRD